MFITTPAKTRKPSPRLKSVFYLSYCYYYGVVDPDAEIGIGKSVYPYSDDIHLLGASESEDLMRKAFEKVCAGYLSEEDLVSNERRGDDWIFWLGEDGKVENSVIVSLTESKTSKSLFASDGSYIKVMMKLEYLGNAEKIIPNPTTDKTYKGFRREHIPVLESLDQLQRRTWVDIYI
jgi:hypothetical protein